MLAVDTNVIVRLLANDDPAQAAQARALIDTRSVFVSVTVLLEAEWVLRSAYGYSNRRIVAALPSVAGLSNVVIEDGALASQALDWANGGMDFADALHLARAQRCEALATFDRRLRRTADKLGTIAIRAP
jgi:predicted nucleic acid-binding protein